MRAQRVHPWRLPWRPHAYGAALRVSPASKFSERYLSCPPNFTTFGHFLQPTTTWIVLTKPFSALLCKKILAPSKVGLNRKRSDFSDLPNGLFSFCTSRGPFSLLAACTDPFRYAWTVGFRNFLPDRPSKYRQTDPRT